MNQDIRRVTGIILRAPLTRRTARELLYCGLGGLAGAIGFYVTIVMLAAGLTISASVLGTVIGLLLLTLALRVSRRLGALHRRLASWLLRYRIEAPPKFQPGTGILGRLDKRLRDRAAWRAVWYSLVKLPVSAVQLYTLTAAVIGLFDITYPVDWVLFHHGSGGAVVALIPLPGGNIRITSFFGTYLAALAGAACVVGATWLARAITAGDRRLVRALLGPSSMSERVSQLERTRSLAVEDSAAALRRVERDLHDGAQMRLAALAMNLGMARDKLGDDDQHADNATVRELLDAAQRNAVDALADLRDLARGIHPPALDNGLPNALATLAASSAIPASVTADVGTRPAPAIETIAYFCAAELIANATKHSYANQIKMKVFTERASVLRLEVTDDGIGGADATRGSGLAGLAQRVSTVDGHLEISSPPGGPTTVTVKLPLKA
jgi:signal transduction histidine kinase